MTASCFSHWDGASGGGSLTTQTPPGLPPPGSPPIGIIPGEESSPYSLHLVLLLQEAQPSPHFMQQLRSLEATASAITLYHHGSMVAYHYRFPGHLKLLSHALAAWGAVPGKDSPWSWHAVSQTLGPKILSRAAVSTQVGFCPIHHVLTSGRLASVANRPF